MGDSDATVLVAMPPTKRRAHLEKTVRDRGHAVSVADDGIAAVDGVRDADAVLVGGYPAPVTAAVVEATTPPGVSRPNVLLSDDDVGGVEERVAPDERLKQGSRVEAVADAVDRAVDRATYTERVSEFSEAAARAASTEYQSSALAERVAGLARDARAVQDDFSHADWTATFRNIASVSHANSPSSRSGNRTS